MCRGWLGNGRRVRGGLGVSCARNVERDRLELGL